MFKSKSLLILAGFVLVFNVFFVTNVNAAGSDTALWNDQASAIELTTGLGNKSPQVIAASIINIVLGFLGILSLALILYAGFKWMTAAGNEDQVSSAKKILVSAVIGLIIILSSYALAAFVLDAVFTAST